MSDIHLTALSGLPEIPPGDDLGARLAAVVPPGPGILVVAQKIVSKAEGRTVELDQVVASPFATRYAKQWDKEPAVIELVLSEARRVVRQLGPVLIKMKNDISYLHMTDAGEEHFLTDYDTRVKKDDVFLSSRTDMLIRPWMNDRWAGGFGFGPSLQSTWAIRTSLMRTRVGGTIGYTVTEGIGFVQKPTVVIDAGINARDEYHEGEGYGAVALSTEF